MVGRKYQRKTIVIGMITVLIMLGSITLSFVAGQREAIHAQAALVDLALPGGANPWGTAIDSNGRVWVALPGCDPAPMCGNNTPPGKIAVYNPISKKWDKVYQLPAGYGQALFVSIDKQGRVWFPMFMTNTLGMLNPATNTIQQWSVPTPAAGPWAVAIDSKGLVWFTEHYSNKIGVFNPETNTFKEIETPASNSQPYGIAVDATDTIWFTENNSAVALIAKYSPQGVLSEYKIATGATSGLTPHMITVAGNGDIWWTEGWWTKLGRLQVALAQPGTTSGVTQYPYPRVCTNCGSHGSGITADKNGQVWFTDSLQNTLAAFPITGTGSFTLYQMTAGNSHPHDGVTVDQQNTIWVSEEFANKLGYLTQSAGGGSTPTPHVSPTMIVTATPPVGATATATVVPTPTSTVTPLPGTLQGLDTFKRPDQTGWGNASDGQKWSGDAGNSSVFSIKNSSGLIANGSGTYNAMLGSQTYDSEVFFTASISKFANTNIGAALRWRDSNNWYKGYIDGSNIVLQKRVNGSATILASGPFIAQAGSSYAIRMHVQGNSLAIKVWPEGTAEPFNWMLTATDSSFQSGYSGLRVQVLNGAVLTVKTYRAQVV